MPVRLACCVGRSSAVCRQVRPVVVRTPVWLPHSGCDRQTYGHHISTDLVERMTADPNNPELLTSVVTDVEAVVIVGALAARGIQAHTTGGYTAGFRAEAPGYVQILVKNKDLDRARPI